MTTHDICDGCGKATNLEECINCFYGGVYCEDCLDDHYHNDYECQCFDDWDDDDEDWNI